MKLYEIADEIEVILAREVDHETGEITDETLEKLAALEMARDEKALAVAAYLKGELAEAEAVLREVDVLKKRAEGHKKRAARLVGYLECYVPPESEPLSDGRSRIAWRKNPPKAAIPDEEKVPRMYRRVVPETSAPDKVAILKALKAGAKLGFATLMQTSRLEVK
jgi:hypothetical protein